MKLTEAQRWILINQYQILAALNPKDAKWYEDRIQILEDGFELHYAEIAHVTRDGETMPAEASKEVIDILSMHRALWASYRNLDDKGGVTEEDIEFSGFDGNEETMHYSYTKWFLNWDGGRFTELGKQDDCNSHWPTLEKYRRMLSVWSKMGRPLHMSLEQIQALMKEKYPHR